ncbi:LytR/AlgR family response regulator transcription factor [Spongiimicrobium salis]|uniref:LytR/AlgR family response regulator transcription factor n=1 Tax=Spongiimicrobium salis TaxID=1667022 RepID=UPI00374D1972
MQELKCLIIDDEPPAIRLLENYISKVSFLECIATSTNPLEALAIIDRDDIDLVFLDIQMPELTGIQLSKLIHSSTKIIFTTAYPQFALESYDLNAVDYLLKPFEFERFYQAVLKVKHLEKPQEITKTDTFIFVKTDGKHNFEKVYLKDICYIEGLKNYVAIHLEHKQIITYNTLKHIEDFLPETMFVKIHKSYIISLLHLHKTDALSVYIKKDCLPIGDTYKQSFFAVIKKMKL